MSAITITTTPSHVVVGNTNEKIIGGENADFILGTNANDSIDAGGGDDFVFSQEGDDSVQAGTGNDLVLGGPGNDLIAGGSGNDTFSGADGVDRFVFDPSNTAEGKDTIVDFAVGEDLIVLNAADILRADPTLLGADGNASSLEITDFTASPNWSLGASEGNLQIIHPGGTITVVNVPAGASTDTFAKLVGALELTGLTTGTSQGETLTGDAAANAILGQGGDDTITGQGGNDALAGGAGADLFVFDPSNPQEGKDTILDFAVGQDLISLDVADILAADPGLPAAAGDPAVLEIADFDAAGAWGISASAGGAVTIAHPGGTITLVGVPFGTATDSFAELAGALQLTGTAGT